MTVDLTVQPLKSVENVVTSKHNENGSKAAERRKKRDEEASIVGPK